MQLSYNLIRKNQVLSSNSKVISTEYVKDFDIEDDKKDILLYNDNMRGVFKRMRPGGFSNGDVKPVCRLDNRGGDGVIFGGGGIGRLIACRRD